MNKKFWGIVYSIHSTITPDKVAHVILWYGITLGIACVGLNIATTAFLALIIGVGKEIYDKCSQRGKFEALDIIADIIGIILAIGTICLLTHNL